MKKSMAEMSATENSLNPQQTELNADDALFAGQIPALVARCFENQRPLKGLAGLLDWRFNGVISQGLRRGIITGKAGECVYVPANKHGRVYHVLLLGMGPAQNPGGQSVPPPASLHLLQKNILGLKLPKIGLSKADFSDDGISFILKFLNHSIQSEKSRHKVETELWITE